MMGSQSIFWVINYGDNIQIFTNKLRGWVLSLFRRKKWETHLETLVYNSHN